MPYFFETNKIRLPYNKDRRRKLTKKDRTRITELYSTGMSIRKIARKFPCCRRAIQFVLFPERLIPAVANRDWKKYYDKDKHKESMRKHRRYKYGVLTKTLTIAEKKRLNT